MRVVYGEEFMARGREEEKREDARCYCTSVTTSSAVIEDVTV